MKVLIIFGLLTYVFCAGGIPGGLTDQTNPEGNAEIVTATNFALGELNGLLGSDPQMSKIEIVSAKTQVVSGINYYLTLKVKYGADVKECHVVISSQSWTNTNKMTSQSCIDLKKSPRSLLGGIVPANMDATTQEAVSFAIESYNQQSNSLFRSQPLKISNVTKQLVAGNLYKFEASLQESDCENSADNKNKGLDQCPPSNSGMKKTCKFSVLQRAWDTPQWTLTEFKCDQA